MLSQFVFCRQDAVVAVKMPIQNLGGSHIGVFHLQENRKATANFK